MEEALKPGAVLSDRYQIESLLGAGGMGEVYLATDASLRRRVAIKVLPQHLTHDEDRVRRFVNEARAVSALNHPNIVTIHEIGSIDSIRFMVTEFIDGETLRHWIINTRRDPRKEIDLMTQIATGLAKAHAAGVVHRDIKPENVMITADGHAKILDFGLAKLLDGGATTANDKTIEQKTADGVVIGTTAYLSPEQAEGRAADHRSDIFSLGVVMYEIVTRRRPFEGRTVVDTMHQIIHSEPKPLTEFDPNVPYELQRIVKKSLAKNPDDRYQSANDLAIDLRTVGREFDSLPRISGPVAPRTRSWMPLLLGIACIAAIAVAFALLMSRNHVTQPRENLAIERVTHTGDVVSAAVSPDGRYVVRARSSGGLSSLAISQIATHSEVTIVPPAPVSFGTVVFSRDGNYIWFSRRSGGRLYYLYRVPALGGPDVQMHEAALPLGGVFVLSPDEKSFLIPGSSPSPTVREIEFARIGEPGVKTIIRRVIPEQILGLPAWAPDGKRFAFFAGAILPRWYVTMFVHDVETGAERRVTTREWAALWGGQGVWTPDGKSVIVAAADRAVSPRQLWEVDAETGAARAITHDVDDYTGLSLSADGRTLVAIQETSESNIWRVDVGNPASARQITFDTASNNAVWGLRWASPTRILYSSTRQEGASLWSMNADGTGNRMIVDSGAYDVYPAISPDGKQIAFSSERSGVWHLWTMNVDGSNPRLFPKTERGVRATYSPDGRWIAFMSWTEIVWRVEASNPDATPIAVTSGRCWSPVFTPDSRAIVCHAPAPQDSNDPDRTLLVPIDGGAVQTLPIATSGSRRGGSGIFRFAPDGNLIYRMTANGATNLSESPLSGTGSRLLTQFTSGGIEDFDISPDGTSIAISRSSTKRDAFVIRNFR